MSSYEQCFFLVFELGYLFIPYCFSGGAQSVQFLLSIRYKDSITKSTRGWKEKLFSRSTSMADISSEVGQEVNSGIANVSRMMERLETIENDRAGRVSLSNHLAESSVTEQGNHNNVETRQQTPLTDNKTLAFAASSVSH